VFGEEVWLVACTSLGDGKSDDQRTDGICVNRGETKTPAAPRGILDIFILAIDLSISSYICTYEFDTSVVQN